MKKRPKVWTIFKYITLYTTKQKTYSCYVSSLKPIRSSTFKLIGVSDLRIRNLKSPSHILVQI